MDGLEAPWRVAARHLAAPSPPQGREDLARVLGGLTHRVQALRAKASP